MKHTPGPWEVDETGCVFDPKGNPIMTCGTYAVRHGEGTEEALANARLIAAAPDLLEVCVQISPIIKAIEILPITRGAEPNSLADALFKAIAKAEGK